MGQKTSGKSGRPLFREGRGSKHPGRFARPPQPAQVEAGSVSLNAAQTLSTAVITERAARLGVAHEDRPLGDVLRDVVTLEACKANGVSKALLNKARKSDGMATSRARTLVDEGAKPEAAVVAAVLAT